MHSVPDTNLMYSVAIGSDHSSEQAQTVNASAAIQIQIARELQAAHSKDRRREAEERAAKKKRGEKRLRPRLAEEQCRLSWKLEWQTSSNK